MIERMTGREQGKENSNELIKSSDHSFFIRTEVGVLEREVVFKDRGPHNNAFGHLEEDISEMGITLFGDTSFNFPITGLFNNGIGTSVFDEFFMGVESVNITDFSDKSGGEVGGDTGNGGDDIDFIRETTISFFDKDKREFFEMGVKESEFVDIIDQGEFKTMIRESYGGGGQIDEVFNGEGRFSPFSCISFQEGANIVEFGRGDGVSGRKSFKYREEVVGEDIKRGFGFGEEYGESIFDLGFAGGDFRFDSFDFSCEEFNMRGGGEIIEELRLRESEQSDKVSVSSVGFGGVVGRDEFNKIINGFRIYDMDIELMVREKSCKREMESSGGFHNESYRIVKGDNFQEGGEALFGHREISFVNDVFGVINDGEIKRVFGNINSNIKHVDTSGVDYLSLVSNLPGCRGLKAQPTNRDLRDRGTDSYRGLKAYKKWGPCPSNLLNFSITKIINNFNKHKIIN